ncbi:MAG TPA: protein translocase subunit SecF [Deltaproteobacteria bacterium]|nr:protein translocase subunit SecF [Deltaproteobacteria bacterium]HOI08653.1 protein translocase subunit SecF [Deltaproteobacteria bacterium]
MELIRPGIFIDFMKYYKYAIALSLVVIAASLIWIFAKGFNYGIDFTGGTEVQVAFTDDIQTDDLRSAVAEAGFPNAVIQSIGIAGDHEFLIRTPTEGDTGYAAAKKIEDGLKGAYGKDKVDIRAVNMVGGAVSKELKNKGFMSLLIANGLLLIYIWFRFQFKYSIGAIVALVHDVIVTLGFFAFTGREISLTVIAALLTLIGFSLNDTVVIYDRIRENIKKTSGPYDLGNLISASLSQTLSRTILTSLTVFIVCVCLFLFGGSVIHDFAFAMIVGVISGVYSTVFIASPVVLAMPGMVQKK